MESMPGSGTTTTQTLRHRKKRTAASSTPEFEEVEEIEEINQDEPQPPSLSSSSGRCPVGGMARGFLSGSGGVFGPDRAAVQDRLNPSGKCPMRHLSEASSVWGKVALGLWNIWVTLTSPLDDVGVASTADGSSAKPVGGMPTEDAKQKCPHLAGMAKAAAAGQCPFSKDGGKKQNSEGHEDGKKESGEADGGDKAKEGSANRCPYQNPEAYEWPMRAVMLFLAYNFISSSIDIQVAKFGFILIACYLGYLRVSEFIVLYVTTGAMSSYKLLGLLLMMTNRGGPVWQWEFYRMTPLAVAGGIFVGLSSIALQYLVREVEVARNFYTPQVWVGSTQSRAFSPLFNVAVPLMNEFVFSGLLAQGARKRPGRLVRDRRLLSLVRHNVSIRRQHAETGGNDGSRCVLGCSYCCGS